MESISLSDDDQDNLTCENRSQTAINQSNSDLKSEAACEFDLGKGDVVKNITNDTSEFQMEPVLEKSISKDDISPRNITEAVKQNTISSESERKHDPRDENALGNTTSTSEMLSTDGCNLVRSLPLVSLPSTDNEEFINGKEEHSLETSTIEHEPSPSVLPISAVLSSTDNIATANEDSNCDGIRSTAEIIETTGVSNDEILSPCKEDADNMKILHGKSENEDLELTNKILQLEEERGKLTTEVMEKEILSLKLEKENNSLRAEVSQLEAQHVAKMSECDRKHKQNTDQMAVKMAEVS